MKKMFVRTADGKLHYLQGSNGGNLVVFSDSKFALRESICGMGTESLYFVKTGDEELSLPPADRTTRGASSQAVATTYTIFEKRPGVQLPQSCIESAEHAIKSIHRNLHDTKLIRNGDEDFCKVNMSIANLGKYDIDVVEDLREEARTAFGQRGPKAHTAGKEKFKSGDGMILVNMEPKGKRADKVWALHAVAVLFTSPKADDPFMVCSEAFADDKAKHVLMTDKWHLAYFDDAFGFHSHYAEYMPPEKYSLWALRAQAR